MAAPDGTGKAAAEPDMPVETELRRWMREGHEALQQARNAAGRYTVATATVLIAQVTQTTPSAASVAIESAVRTAVLPVFTLGGSLPVRPPADRSFADWSQWHEVRAVDVNSWLAETGVVARVPDPSGAAPRRAYKAARQDALAPVIRAAVVEVGSDSTAPVFKLLTDWALAERSPFTGATSAKALEYTDAASGGVKSLTRAALTDRLHRSRKR